MTWPDCRQNIARTDCSIDASRVTNSALLITERREGVMFVKVLTIVTCVFSAGIAVVIGVRLDQDHVSILTGLMIGAVLGAPIASIITYLVVRKRQSDAIYCHRPYQPPTGSVPPQVVYLPAPMVHQPIPSVTRQPASWSPEPFVMSKQRRVYVIGDTGNTDESQQDSR